MTRLDDPLPFMYTVRMCNVMHMVYRCLLAVLADILCHRHCEKALSTHMQHYIACTTHRALCTLVLLLFQVLGSL